MLFSVPGTYSHSRLPSRHSRPGHTSMVVRMCVNVLGAVAFPIFTQSFAVTYAASIPLMTWSCCHRSLLHVEPKPSFLFLLLFGTTSPSAAAQTNCIARKLACVSPPAFLLEAKHSYCISCSPQDVAAKTLHFPLRIFWILLNLWLFLNLSILKHDFQT